MSKRLNRDECKAIIDQYTNLAIEVHGYAYAAGSLQSMLTDAIAELKLADQSFAINVVAGIAQKMAERKAAGVTADNW